VTVSTPPATALESAAAASMIGVEPPTLKMWRRKGIGPAYVRFGNRVRYRLCDIEDWLAAHTVRPERP
jgi:predicted site-specific integrase-resolvase